MSTILVTGATGTVGREVVPALRASGARMRVLVRDAAKADGLRAPDVEVAVGDYGDHASLRAAMHGVERLFLLVPPGPEATAQERALIDAAVAGGVRHVVKLSAIGADEAQPCAFLRHHGVAERMLHESGLAWTMLRPNGFFTNLSGSFGESVARQGAIHAPAGSAPLSYVHPRDVGEVAAAMLAGGGHEGETHVLTGPEALGYADFARVLSEELRRRVLYVDVPPDAARQAMLASGMPPWFVEAVLDLYAYMRTAPEAGQVTDNVPRTLGRPATSFAEFVREDPARFGGIADPAGDRAHGAIAP